MSKLSDPTKNTQVMPYDKKQSDEINKLIDLNKYIVVQEQHDILATFPESFKTFQGVDYFRETVAITFKNRFAFRPIVIPQAATMTPQEIAVISRAVSATKCEIVTTRSRQINTTITIDVIGLISGGVALYKSIVNYFKMLGGVQYAA